MRASILLAVTVLALAICIRPANSGENTGMIYYLSADGDDARSGRSPEEAWRTIAPLNALGRLGPGDTVRLRGGDSFVGGLQLVAVGSDKTPCVIESYGKGKAKLTTPGNVPVIKLSDSEHVVLRNIVVEGRPGKGTYPSATFEVLDRSLGTWVGSDRRAGKKLGRVQVTGMEYRYVYHAICFQVLNNAADGWDDVTISGCVIEEVPHAGLFMSGPDFFGTNDRLDLFTNVRIADNVFRHIYGDPSGNSEAVPLGIANATGVVIERNLFADNCGFGGCGPKGSHDKGGSAAVQTFSMRRFVMRHNEAFGTRSCTPYDACALDCDNNTQDGEVCFNLTYRNKGPGIQLGSVAPGSLVKDVAIHHNISIDDARGAQPGSIQGAFRLWGLNDSIQVFNNTICVRGGPGHEVIGKPSAISFARVRGTNTHILVMNNILKTSGGIPMIRVNAAGEYEVDHIDASCRFFGNVYDSSGGPLAISNDDTRGAYRAISTLKEWRACGQESDGETDLGRTDDAGLPGLAEFNPPAGGYLAQGLTVGTCCALDPVVRADQNRDQCVMPWRFVTCGNPTKRDFHGADASDARVVGAVARPGADSRSR